MAEAVFQFAPESSGSNRVGVSGAAPTLGVSGGNSTNNGAVRFADTTDLGAGSTLPAFLSEAFAPKINAMVQQRIFEGATQAAIGRSQSEIDEDQPWYTKIFGPTPYQSGAAVFTTDKVMSDMDTYVMNEMPRLRTLAPQDVAKEIQGKALENVGDNPYTSMLVTQSLMKRMGPILDVHTKERYAWQQTELKHMKIDSNVSAMASFDATRRRLDELGNKNPNDPTIGHQRVEVVRNMLEQLQLPADMSDDTAKAIWTDTIIKAADAGHFSAIAQVVDTGISGTMDASDVSRLQGYVSAKWNTFKENQLLADPGMLQRVNELKVAARQGLHGEAVAEDMKQFDKEFQSKYGYMPYFSGDEYVGETVTGSMAFISNEEQKQREEAAARKASMTEAEKAAADARLTASYSSAVVSGGAADMMALDGADSARMNAVAFSKYMALRDKDPATAGQILVNNFAEGMAPFQPVVSRLKQELDVATGGPYTDSYLVVQRQYDAMRAGKAAKYNPMTQQVESTDTTGGPATANAYFGIENAKRMERFADLVRTTPAQVAYSQVWGNSPNERPTITGATSDETKKIRAEFKSQLDSLSDQSYKMATGFATGVDARLTASAAELVGIVTAEEYAALPDTGDYTSRIKNAINNAKAKGLELHGHFAWQNPGGGGQTRIASYFNSNDAAFTPVLDQVLTKRLKEVGVVLKKDTRQQVDRYPDEMLDVPAPGGGTVRKRMPVLVVSVQDDDDLSWKMIRVTGADMEAERRKPREKSPDVPNAPLVMPRAGGRNTN